MPAQPDAEADAAVEAELSHPEGANRPLTAEELRVVLRRAARARRQAMRERQRVLEEQRRRRPYAPPPPPTQPQP